MAGLVSLLAQYGAYHRRRSNLATHFVGIPMIVLAIEVVLSRPVADLAGLPLTPAMLAALLATLFYLRLDLAFGLVMGAVLAFGAWAGLETAVLPQPAWLALSGGLFATGWLFQFAGHLLEGRRPAFVDDLIGLLAGPLFLVAELAFALGLRAETRRAVEAELMRLERGQPAV